MVRSSPPRQRPRERTVREGKLDATLNRFNMEIANKTALTIAEYDRKWVEPLRERVERIELWLGIRAARWLKNCALAVYAGAVSRLIRLKERFFPTPEPLPAMEGVPEVEES